MTMKNFFTIFSFLFLGVVVAILVAGYISRDNRLMREAYTKKTEEQLAQIASSVGDSQKKIDILEEKFKEQQAVSTSVTSTKKATTTKKTPTGTTTPSGTKLTSALVGTHSSATDCWIIVSAKVYSVSPYLSMHPGGKSVIIKGCGKDATTAFTSRGGTGEHSSSAWKLLGQFLVGALGATVKL